jgi:hypothetical protein
MDYYLTWLILRLFNDAVSNEEHYVERNRKVGGTGVFQLNIPYTPLVVVVLLFFPHSFPLSVIWEWNFNVIDSVFASCERLFIS